MIPFMENAVEVALIVLCALGLMPLLRSRAAALRHWVLAAGLLCAAAAPLVGLLVPSWRLPALWPSSETTIAQQDDDAAVTREPASLRGSVNPRTESLGPAAESLSAALFWIWLLGATLCSTVLLAGLTRLNRLAAGAREVSHGKWVRHADEIRRGYGLRRPVRLLQSDHAALLVTWGVVHPKVLLPAGAAAWGDDRIRLVLAHELAHIRRGDWVITLAAEVLRAIHWFNPALWAACRRLRQESERACDDAVLNRGVESAAYAASLIDIARELHRPPMWIPAPSIVRMSNLERRVRAMLDPRTNRRPVSRSTSAAALLAVLMVTIPVTGAAVAQVLSTVTGSIVDPTNSAVPGVTLVLTNMESKAKYEVHSDRTGRYEVVGVPAGEYALEAKLPGFAALRGRLSVAGQNVQQDLKLQVGSLQETIHIRASASRPDTSAPAPADPGLRERRRQQREASRCETPKSQDGTVIGGHIRPPAKIRDVRPVYPSSALSAGIEGTVLLRATIGVDGAIDEVTVVSAPHADLASAAVDAVRQWEFDATLLNCVPIPVNVGVTLNFELER